VQARLRRVTQAAHALERERRPVVAPVPDQDRREQTERHERGERGLGAQPLTSRAPVEQQECERADTQERDRVFREQPETETDSRAPPRARPQLDLREPQEIQRARPRGRERRVGSHEQTTHEAEREGRDQREHGERRGPAQPASGERGREARGHERADERAQPDRPLTVTGERRRPRDEPRHERRVIEIRPVQVLRVAPVVRLFGQELERAGVRDPQREQIGERGNAAEADRHGSFARRGGHPERRAHHRHGRTQRQAGREREDRRETRLAHDARERAAAQQNGEETHEREASRAAAAELAGAERERGERSRRAGCQVRGRE